MEDKRTDQWRWAMPSSSGRAVFRGVFERGAQPIQSDLIFVHIGLAGVGPNYKAANPSFIHPVDKSCIEVRDIEASLSRVRSFASEILLWREGDAVSSDWSFNRNNEVIEIYIGPPPPDMKILSKNVFILSYVGSNFHAGRWIMEIDQSCISLFQEEIMSDPILSN